MGLSSGKDFVAANVTEAPAAASCKQRAAQPPVQYVFKFGFGEVPGYLVERQAELAAAAAAAAAAAQAPQVLCAAAELRLEQGAGVRAG